MLSEYICFPFDRQYLDLYFAIGFMLLQGLLLLFNLLVITVQCKPALVHYVSKP